MSEKVRVELSLAEAVIPASMPAESVNLAEIQQQTEEGAMPQELVHFFVDACDYFLAHTKEWEEKAEVKLRPIQLRMIQNFKNDLAAGHDKGYFVLPTGVGKTVLFLAMISAFMGRVERRAMELKTRAAAPAETKDERPKKVLLVVPYISLATQTEGEIKKKMKGASYTAVHSAVRRGRKTKKNDTQPRIEQCGEGVNYTEVQEAVAAMTGCEVTIIVADSLISGLKNKTINPLEYGMVVYDEAHKYLGPETKKVPGFFSHAVQTGFTATDAYAKDKRVSNILPHEYGRVTLPEAKREGMICPCESAIIPVEISEVELETEVEKEMAELMKEIAQLEGGQVSDRHHQLLKDLVMSERSRKRGRPRTLGESASKEELLKVLRAVLRGSIYNRKKIEKMVDIYAEHFTDEPALMFCESIEDATKAVERAQEKGLRAAAFHSQLFTKDYPPAIANMTERQRAVDSLLEDFKNGQYDVIAGVSKLGTGIDLPNASLGIFANGNLGSVVELTQQVGRLLRLDTNNSNKVSIALQFAFVCGDRAESPALPLKKILDDEVDLRERAVVWQSASARSTETETPTMDLSESLQAAVKRASDRLGAVVGTEAAQALLQRLAGRPSGRYRTVSRELREVKETRHSTAELARELGEKTNTAVDEAAILELARLLAQDIRISSPSVSSGQLTLEFDASAGMNGQWKVSKELAKRISEEYESCPLPPQDEWWNSAENTAESFGVSKEAASRHLLVISKQKDGEKLAQLFRLPSKPLEKDFFCSEAGFEEVFNRLEAEQLPFPPQNETWFSLEKLYEDIQYLVGEKRDELTLERLKKMVEEFSAHPEFVKRFQNSNLPATASLYYSEKIIGSLLDKLARVVFLPEKGWETIEKFSDSRGLDVAEVYRLAEEGGLGLIDDENYLKECLTDEEAGKTALFLSPDAQTVISGLIHGKNKS